MVPLESILSIVGIYLYTHVLSHFIDHQISENLKLKLLSMASHYILYNIMLLILIVIIIFSDQLKHNCDIMVIKYIYCQKNYWLFNCCLIYPHCEISMS